MSSQESKDLKYLRWCEQGASIFSTCSLRQYMAIVLSGDGRVVGTGYNGSPPKMGHCVDGYCERARNPSTPGENYSNCVAVHAEANALIHSDRTARLGGTVYVNGYCCFDCAKLVAGSGVARLVVVQNSYESWPASRVILRSSNIDITEYQKEQIYAFVKESDDS